MLGGDVAWRVVEQLRRPAPEDALSAREREVLGSIVAGHTKRRVGELLFLSPHTVSFHVGAIYEKSTRPRRRARARRPR